MFGLIFLLNDKENFQLSNLRIGCGIAVVNPQLEGEWAGMRVLWTPEPCLRGPENWEKHIPSPLPESVSNTISKCFILVIEMHITHFIKHIDNFGFITLQMCLFLI